MRNLDVKRVVVKIGTNTLCREDGGINSAYLEDVARQVVELQSKGIQCIVVSSGAIGPARLNWDLMASRKMWQ